MRNLSVFQLLVALVALTCFTTALHAEQVKLDAELGTPVVLAGQKQTAYLRVAMTGLPMEGGAKRTPANVALVLDRSGSMQGEKLAQLKDAAIMALERLNGDDIVSVVVYDETVTVLVPATRLSDRDKIYTAIKGLGAGGSTALFGGMSKGAQEVRKFLDRNRVNRIILLSDGLANVGPSSPGALGELGASLAREGIAVSTLGLGIDYNEDLMTTLAQNSDGNHWFIENGQDLKTAFNKEFGDVVSVVAQDVNLRISCAHGVRPVRAIGRKVDIAGQTVSTALNQIYDRQFKYLLLELELPEGASGSELPVAKVEITYANMATQSPDAARQSVSVTYSDSPVVVEAKTNAEVMASAIQQIGVERNRLAMELRDQGKLEEGKKVLDENTAWLYDNATRYNSQELLQDWKTNGSISTQWDGEPEKWQEQRKVMKYYQHSVVNGQDGAQGTLVPSIPRQPRHANPAR